MSKAGEEIGQHTELAFCYSVTAFALAQPTGLGSLRLNGS